MAKATDNNAGRNAGQDRPALPLASDSSGSLLGCLASLAVVAVVATARLVAKVWHGLTADGTLGAAARAGRDELGMALRAFPDSIQISGNVFDPTPGEIQASRSRGGHSSTSIPRHPTPSQILRDPKPQPDTGRHHRDGGNSM